METITKTSVLQEVLDYVSRLINIRLATFFEQKEVEASPIAPIQVWNGTLHPLVRFCATHQLSETEFFVLALALVPHLNPYLLDEIIQQYLPNGGSFPRIGGIRGQNQRSFLPTGETALFILAHDDLDKRLSLQALFNSTHLFAQKQVLYLGEVSEGEPKMSGQLILSEEYAELFTIGKITPPKYSSTFPAKRLRTNMDWEDLIVAPDTEEKLKYLERWLAHHDWLIENTQLAKRIKPGFKALFYGPPGTGKTLAASILGNKHAKPVYRIDLSQIVSKYIGETEKNLSTLFAKAENKNWILFFDEADALFGKRVNVKDAKDKFANQETSYLLQRIEDYPGLVILASNFKDNIDKAFMRRFHSIVHFPFPAAPERLRLWTATLPALTNSEIALSPEVNMARIAKKYKLSGSNINNIVQYCCYLTKDLSERFISEAVIFEGIEREFEKVGKFA